MKKISIFMAIIMIILCFSGCSHQNEETEMMENILQDTLSQIENLKTSTNDPIFWSSAEHVTDLIGKTLEKDKNIEVDYRLQIGRDTKIITGFSVYMVGSDSIYRQSSVTDLLLNLASSEEVASAHLSGQSVEVTGAIIRWQDRKNWYSKEMMDFSACELDSEGSWDYTCRGRLEFFGMPHVISVEYEVKGVELNQLYSADGAVTLSDLRRATF